MEIPKTYDPKSLTWNQLHTKNQEGIYCYCGKDRNLTDLNLQCEKCLNWFHSRCVKVDLGPVVPFIANYQFQCAWCNDGEEFFERTTASWKNIITTAIANHILTYPPRLHFGKDEVVNYLKMNWDAICTRREQTKTWWATVGTCMSTSPETFIPQPGKSHSASSPFTILDTDLMNIRPAPPGFPSKGLASDADSAKGAKKKATKVEEPKDLKKKGKGDKVEKPLKRDKKGPDVPNALMEKLRKQGPVESVTNRDDYRYILAEEDPCIPGSFRERYIESGVFLSREDRSPFIYLGKDRLSAWTEKGFRLCRSTHFCNSGNWYYEVTVSEPKTVTPSAQSDRVVDGPHVRIGFAQKYATIEAPVGFDEFGYCYRDKTGEKVHLSFPTPYGEPYTQGDVIGVLIELPERKRPLCEVRRVRTAIVVKGTLYFEEHSKKPDRMQKLPGSRITFFKNGVSQGVAFADLYEGDYYPAVSLYRGGHVTVNFGPDFKYPPPLASKDPAQPQGMLAVDWKPFSERFQDTMVEEALMDIVDDVEIELEP